MKRNGYNTLTKLLVAYLFVLSGSLFTYGQTPVANFTATTLAGCSPLIVTFQDQSTGNPTTWSWDFGNGNTSSLQNPTASYFTPGNYTISLTVANSNGTNTLTRTQYITVYENPTVDFSIPSRNGCFPFRVQFTDLSTAGVGNTNVQWQWDFGNGTTSTLQNPFVTYTTAGNFTITLRVTNDKGCFRVISRPAYISVTPGVTGVFSNSQATVCSAPATINFTNTSGGPPVLSYFWDFGDGNFSGATSPSHTYSANGTYTAILVVSSSQGCEDTIRSQPIIIGGNTTTFSAPASACINELVNFTNTSTPVPVSTVWDFGDAGTANTINAVHSYVATGNYIVRMYNTYANCTDSSIQNITINPRPVTDFTAPITSKCEPDLTVNFQDISTGGATSWEWDFGDGNTSTQQNPAHIYTAYGAYTVRLISWNAFNCPDTIVKTNYIRIQRAVIRIPQLPARGCVPYTINFTPLITSVDAVTSYLWDFGDGGSSTLQNPTYIYNTQGTYTVKLFITTSSGCTDSLVVTQAVRVGNKPIADFNAIPNPVCGRQPVSFTDLTNVADEWLWSFGDGGSSILQNPTHNYTDTGYFDIILIATNNGCADTIERLNYMKVNPPIAIFDITPDCVNRFRFVFTDRSLVNPAVTPLTWEWDFGDGNTSALQSPAHIYTALGIYNIRLIVTNGTCKDTAYSTVNVINENPDFVATATIACKRATIGFTALNINPLNIISYNWDFGDGNTSIGGTIDIFNTYTVAGTYTVRLITVDINGCRDTVLKTNYIRINGPTAGFSPVNPSGCAGLTVNFTDNSTTDGVNALTSWTWVWGDGNTSTYTAPPPAIAHQYNTTGSFTVKLVVTDAAGCRDSTVLDNIINTTDPVPDFISLDSLTCPNAIVNFTNTSTPLGTTALWDFGNGNTSALYSPSTSYNMIGQYTVKLVITDNWGCRDSITKTNYITVDEPNAAFTLNDSISSCTPFEVRFTNTSTYYRSSFWTFGDGGTSSDTNPTHYFSTPGSYIVRLLVTSPGGCLDSAFTTINVYDTVGSRVNYVPLGGCKPLDVTLNTLTTGPMDSYFWDFGDGYTVTTTTPNVNHIYRTYGNFLPKIIMQDQTGCIIPLQGLDTVFVTGANNKFGYSDSVFCDRGTVNFTDSTTFNDPIRFYNWVFGDGNTSTLQNPSHTYTSPGLYTVTLMTETQIGCRDTLAKPLVIMVVQSPVTNIGGDSVFCINLTKAYTGDFVIADTSNVRWQWVFPNGNTSSLQNPPPQTFNTAGTFNILSVATNSTGCYDSTIKTIIVNPLPTATLPGQMTVQAGFPVTIPATYSPNTVSWLWSPAAGLSCTTCPSPAADPDFTTNFLVYYTDTNGCSNISAVLVTVICRNANVFVPNTFSPNGDASNEIFYPRGRGIERIKMLRIFNRWGEVVYEKYNFPVNDASAGWNGTYKGKKPQSDTYVYQIEVFCDNGDTIKLNGNVSLLL